MGASDDEDEYIVYGRPLQEELESAKGQYSKEIQDKSVTRALPVWQQEVVDEQGRRRLHGAFTGGYSAGYFNTVGSKDGWAPSNFKSSRDKRSETRTQQTAEDFMDEDELEELGRRKITTRSDYDTFGHDAEEKAKTAMLSSMKERPGLPMAIIRDLIAPVPDSIGIRLLQKMGWRQGKGVGKRSRSGAGSGGSKWGEMVSLGTENVKFYDLPNKDDTHGLGFDPFKGAQDFRNAREAKNKDPRSDIPAKRKRGVAFGSGIMDEDDTLGMTDDYVTDIDPRQGFDFEIHSEEEDDRPSVRHQVREQYRLPGKADPLRLQSKEQAQGVYDLIPGFIKAVVIETQTHFPPPKLPPEYQPFHQFPPERSHGATDAGEEPPQPSGEVLKAIRTIAPFVARMGPAFEALALQKHSSDPNFGFLSGGEGALYYRWSLRALKVAQQDKTGLAIGQRAQPLTANDRGMLLGESDAHSALPLAGGPAASVAPRRPPAGVAEGDKQALQEAMRATFTRGRQQDLEATNPDPAGFGLRLGKAAQAAAVSGQQAGKAAPAAAQAWLQAAQNKFASSTVMAPEAAEGGLMASKPAVEKTEEKKQAKRLPTRTVIEWRPSPLLCKRFNVPDPFRGKPAYKEETPQSKFDSLSLPETAAAAASASQPISHMFGQGAQTESQGLMLPPPPARPPSDALPAPPLATGSSDRGQNAGELADNLLTSLLGGPQGEPEAQPAPIPAQKPINLFQAIFEDDSESDSDEDVKLELQSTDMLVEQRQDAAQQEQTANRYALGKTAQETTDDNDNQATASDNIHGSKIIFRTSKSKPGQPSNVHRQLQTSKRTPVDTEGSERISDRLAAEDATPAEFEEPIMAVVRDESRIRTGGEALDSIPARTGRVQHNVNNFSHQPDAALADGLGESNRPSQTEIQAALQILNKHKHKDKRKDKDKKKKSDKKKSKESKSDKKHHKTRRKSKSTSDGD